VPRPPHQADDFLGKRVVTEDGKIHLAPPALLAQAAKLDADFAHEQATSGALKLITRRHVNTHNSWTHNDPEFISGGRDTNFLYVHPDDAARTGLKDGDLADVSTDTATVRLPIRLLEDLMPGTVAMPHGWGHQHATGLSVASKTERRERQPPRRRRPRPPRTRLRHGPPHRHPRRVAPAAGPRATDDWSGIAPKEKESTRRNGDTEPSLVSPALVPRV
jgi:anaerobic selenocysteine-containing dehydrogenase